MKLSVYYKFLGRSYLVFAEWPHITNTEIDELHATFTPPRKFLSSIWYLAGNNQAHILAEYCADYQMRMYGLPDGEYDFSILVRGRYDDYPADETDLREWTYKLTNDGKGIKIHFDEDSPAVIRDYVTASYEQDFNKMMHDANMGLDIFVPFLGQEK